MSEKRKNNSIDTEKIRTSVPVLQDLSEPETSAEKAKGFIRDFINRFRSRRSTAKKEPFKANPKVVFAILGIICAALIILSSIFDQVAAPFRTAASYLIVPAQSGINVVGSWLADRFDEFRTLQDLSEENRALREENDRLKAENNDLIQENSEIERYRELLELKNEYRNFETTAAQIISKDPSKWFSTFTINKGTEQGIARNMNVVAHGGLVGVISEVGRNYAVVRTVIDDSSNISAMFERSTDLCVVSGNLSSMEDNVIDFSDASVSVELSEGTSVVTSNVSSIYLPGLLIGYISDYKIDGNELTQSGHITPVVDFEDLSEVLIILQLKETMD